MAEARIRISRRRDRRYVRSTAVIRCRSKPVLLFVLALTADALQPRRSATGLFRSTTAQPSSSTRRHVLTTPEAVFEQASTKHLLDDLIDESVRTSARRPIIMQFDPSSGWIWKRWKGTVFSETWDSCVSRMVYAAAVFLICSTYPRTKTYLSGFNVLWGQLLSVTTFTLTFFVNQSYALWRKCTDLSRRLQGRLLDLHMTLAAHAARKPSSSPNEPSTYTTGSRQLLELVGRYGRLFNLLTYASFTRSHRPMLTPRGMRRLVERGLMTPQEREVLIRSELPATQRHNAVLSWIVRVFVEGCEAGHFVGDAGFEQQFIEKAHVARASYGAIGDELNGRMPLAYAHIVQVLVDVVLWLYPFMAVASGMSGFLCVLGTGLLTIGYQGLFDLAKQFLDPYDNETYGKGEDPLVVDTLIAETNAGSVRWMHSLDEMPVSPQRIKDGELSDYLLPLRGYSVEELAQMEEEQRELEEKRQREERERILAEEAKKREREAAEAMIPAIIDIPEPDAPLDSSFVSANGAVDLPSVLRTASLSDSETVADFISVMSHSLPNSFVPEGTALASEYVEELIEKTEEEEAEEEEEEELVDEETERIQFGGDDEDEEIPFHVLQDWGSDSSYVHTFEAFDPYMDLPEWEKVGPDGKEVRLSQMMADEVWEEEIEAAKERETIRTYEQYMARVNQLKESAESEMLETEEILRASPGAETGAVPKRAETGYPPIYDQTKLDGFSQLWGLPPDDWSQIPSYEEPPVPPFEMSSISQLWGDSSATTKPRRSGPEETVGSSAFSGISQLWGEDLDEEDEDVLSASATRRITRDDLPASATRRIVSDDAESKEYRLSQMLADEEWGDEAEFPLAEQPITFKDYEKQVADILEEEKKELLETEAIMNAPPAAQSVEIPEEEGDDTVPATNTTTVADDDLAALEMDAPEMEDKTSKVSSNATQAAAAAAAGEECHVNGNDTAIVDSVHLRFAATGECIDPANKSVDVEFSNDSGVAEISGDDDDSEKLTADEEPSTDTGNSEINGEDDSEEPSDKLKS